MLRRIILENFMSHGRTEIDLADGLTVLTGPNNCGKSAVVAALQILANNGRTKHVLRHGAKFCRITVETDDGHTICWERKKTTVKYTINGEDIHRVGVSIPDSLHEFLRLDQVVAETGKTTHEYDIHFGEQKSPVFLLSESGSRAASFFASSSDASRLVEMQHRHRLKLREQKATAKRLTAEQQVASSRLAAFEPLDAVSERMQTADSSLSEINRVATTIDRLRELVSEVRLKTRQQEHWQVQCHTLDRLDQVKTTPEQLQQKERTAARLRDIRRNVLELNQRRSFHDSCVRTLARLKVAPKQHDTSRIQPLMDELTAGGRRIRWATAVLKCCSSLTAVPVREPASSCRRAITLMTKAKAKQHDLSQARDALRQLESPPAESSTARLKQVIVDLRNRLRTASLLRQDAETLATLQPLAMASQSESLSELIARLGDCLNNVKAAKKKSQKSQQKARECEQEIRKFVESNPRCSSCGAELNAETLMASVPGVHRHTSVSISDGDSAHEGYDS